MQAALIKKIVGKFSRGERRRIEFKKGKKPIRDWFILIGTLFVLLAGAAGFSYYVFANFVDEKSSDVEFFSERIRTIDEELLDETIDVYEERKRAFSEYLESPPVLIDPSL